MVSEAVSKALAKDLETNVLILVLVEDGLRVQFNKAVEEIFGSS